MPLTFAHPAAAIPLLRPLGRFGSLSALIIGSIAPDMSFFVPIGVTREQTHGLAALFLFCLPVGLLTYLLFHGVLKAPLRALLPNPIAARIPSAAARIAARSLTDWLAVLVSILCGAMSHVAWDAFTHPGTAVVNAIAWLQTPLAHVGGYQLFGYKLLQHGGTVVGLGLLATWTLRWVARTEPASVFETTLRLRTRCLILISIAGFSIAAGVMAVHLRDAPGSDAIKVQALVAAFVFAALPALTLALTVYSLLWQITQRSALASSR